MWTLRVFVTPHGYSGALRGDALAYMYGRKKYVQNLPPVGCRHSSNQQQAHQISPQTLIRTGGYKNTCVCTPPTVCTNTRGGGWAQARPKGGGRQAGYAHPATAYPTPPAFSAVPMWHFLSGSATRLKSTCWYVCLFIQPCSSFFERKKAMPSETGSRLPHQHRQQTADTMHPKVLPRPTVQRGKRTQNDGRTRVAVAKERVPTLTRKTGTQVGTTLVVASRYACLPAAVCTHPKGGRSSRYAPTRNKRLFSVVRSLCTSKRKCGKISGSRAFELLHTCKASCAIPFAWCQRRGLLGSPGTAERPCGDAVVHASAQRSDQLEGRSGRA